MDSPRQKPAADESKTEAAASCRGQVSIPRCSSIPLPVLGTRMAACPAGRPCYTGVPPIGFPADSWPRQEVPMDVTPGEVLYLCLVVAVAWWAYSTLKEFL